MKKFVFLLAAVVAVAAMAAEPAREFRGVWYTTVFGIDWPSKAGTTKADRERSRAELVRDIDRLADINVNTVCFQVRSMCDAAYKSPIEPWSASVTGKRGASPGWDPLKVAVERCHERGLECYAWINPLRWSAGTDYDTPYDRQLKADSLLLTFDKYTVLNPALPAARKLVIDVTRDIVTRYPLDGVIFDDYFYPNNIPEDETAADWALYKASGTDMTIGDWRRDNINSLLAEIGRMIEAEHPDVRYAVGPAGVAGKADTSAPRHGIEPCPVKAPDWQYATIYSDPLAWMKERSIDFISPQLYWPTTHATAPYEPLCRWWADVAQATGTAFIPSVSVGIVDKGDTIANRAEMLRQIRLTRDIAAGHGATPGVNFFSTKSVLGSFGDELRDSVFTRPVLPPAHGEPVGKYGVVNKLKLNGHRLTWQPVKPAKPGATVRYAVFFAPKLDSDAELLGITYEPEFALTDEQLNRCYRIIVSVLDGNGHLHKPHIMERKIK